MRWTCYSLLLWSASMPAGELGRLFYTPQQRVQIDARHSFEQATVEPGASEVQLKGVVRRSDGKTTLWVNGAAPETGNPGRQPGSATVALPDGSRAEMRVGDKWQAGETQPSGMRITRGTQARYK